jgi:probable rRNA maturation factor
LPTTRISIFSTLYKFDPDYKALMLERNSIGFHSAIFFVTCLILLTVASAFNTPTCQMFACRSILLNIGARKYSTNFKIPRTFSPRLFGSKAGVPENPPGTVAIYNDQQDIPDIDEEALRGTIHRISKILGYETYDVTLLLVDDEEMRETNLESRGIDAPTDILSFPFHDYEEPGELVEPEFDIPDYYTLGDMVVDIPYIMRRCKEDQEDADAGEEDDERGVSGAMATVYDPEQRIHMLLVHGMLHLVGHDHEEDDEYELMVSEEEKILKELSLMR